MKKLFWVFTVFLLVLGNSCKQNNSLNPIMETQQRENEWTIEQVLTIFQNRQGGTFYMCNSLPEGYVPSKTGEWNFDCCYLFQRQGGVSVEFYTFPNNESYAAAGPGCSKELFAEDDREYCLGEGRTCSINSDEIIVVRCPL